MNAVGNLGGLKVIQRVAALQSPERTQGVAAIPPAFQEPDDQLLFHSQGHILPELDFRRNIAAQMHVQSAFQGAVVDSGASVAPVLSRNVSASVQEGRGLPMLLEPSAFHSASIGLGLT